jgi:hypothetical protein
MAWRHKHTCASNEPSQIPIWTEWSVIRKGGAHSELYIAKVLVNSGGLQFRTPDGNPISLRVRDWIPIQTRHVDRNYAAQ